MTRYPPPSLRDTSASGGHEKVIFAIMIQALKRDWEEFLKSSDGRKDIKKRIIESMLA